MSLESNSVVSCVLKWILISFVFNHLVSKQAVLCGLVCNQAVLCGIVIVTHLPLNWRNDCGCFSFPLWPRPLYWVVIGQAHCTELSLATPTVPSCHWPRPLYWVVTGFDECFVTQPGYCAVDVQQEIDLLAEQQLVPCLKSRAFSLAVQYVR